MINRRTFLCGLTIGTLAAPLAVEGQHAGKVHRVGYLSGTVSPDLVEALRQGLRELGWTEGRNLAIESRHTSQYEKVPELAAELVRGNVDVIVATASAMPYLGKASANVPVVFVIAEDPVSAGYVASLGRPGGRMTGLTSLNVGLDAKRLEILKAALPGVERVGVLSASQDPTHRERVANAEQAARALGLQLTILEGPRADLIPGVLDAAGRARVGAIMVFGTPRLRLLQARIAELTTKARMPAISAWRDLPDAGGLMSYGTSVPAMFRRAATFVDRILKGMKPADLPVEQASTFELVINLKTAKALGLTIPQSVLLRADQIIE